MIISRQETAGTVAEVAGTVAEAEGTVAEAARKVDEAAAYVAEDEDDDTLAVCTGRVLMLQGGQLVPQGG